MITNILVKALTAYPDTDFSLCLHLLPPNVLTLTDDPLSEGAQKLYAIYLLLEAAEYQQFWSTLDSDDLYADLVADCRAFEEHVRRAIARSIEMSMTSIDLSVLSPWLNREGTGLEEWIASSTNWEIDGDSVKIPLNKDNDVRPVITREAVKLEQLNKLLKRAYEQ